MAADGQGGLEGLVRSLIRAFRAGDGTAAQHVDALAVRLSMPTPAEIIAYAHRAGELAIPVELIALDIGCTEEDVELVCRQLIDAQVLLWARDGWVARGRRWPGQTQGA